MNKWINKWYCEFNGLGRYDQCCKSSLFININVQLKKYLFRNSFAKIVKKSSNFYYACSDFLLNFHYKCLWQKEE